MKVIRLTSSALNLVQACARKFDLTYNQHLGPLHQAEALEKGSLMHHMLEVYYKGIMAGIERHELIEECVHEGRQIVIKMDVAIEVAEEVIGVFRDYCEHYAADYWSPIAVEQAFSKELYRDDNLTILFEGKMDLVAETRDGILVVDHKTGARNSEPSMLSNQFMAYAWALDVNNVVINKVGFQKTKALRFRRHVLSYPKEVLAEWRDNTIFWCTQLVHFSSRNHYPPNFTSCDKYAGCIYQPICSSIPGARDWKKKTEFKERIPGDKDVFHGIAIDDDEGE